MNCKISGVTKILLNIAVPIALLAPVLLVADALPIVEMPSSFPGESLASSTFSWLDPYVLFQQVIVPNNIIRKVTWYSRDGQVIKELMGRRLEARGDFIMEHRADTIIIHNACNTLAITLPPDQRFRECYLHGQDYGKYFYRQYTIGSNTYTDFYKYGLYAGTYGSHCWITGNTINVSTSGSIAYSVSDSTTSEFCKIVSIDSLGNEVFTFLADGPLVDIISSPTGEQVIINYNLDEANNRSSDDFACFFSSGEIVRVKLWPNGELIGWVPDTKCMIVRTSIGDDYTYHLLDWKSGEIAWSLNNKAPDYILTTSSGGMAFTKDYFILTGLASGELIPNITDVPVSPGDNMLMMVAIDVKTGVLAAKWYEPIIVGNQSVGSIADRASNRGGRFTWYDNNLYYVTDKKFSMIDLNDIKNLKNGWVDPADSAKIYYNEW